MPTSARRPIMSWLVAIAIKITSGLILITPSSASAGSLLDYIRDYDLNDYALGLSIATSQSPYLGADNSVAAYPILTSFCHSSLTDDWLLIQGENLGFRYVTDNHWELGLIGRIQYLGAGVTRSDDLLGLDEREWAVEGGPLIGWRGFPVHVQFRSYWEAPSRHSGTTSELEFRLPWEHQRGYIVPSVTWAYLSDDYAAYYFGVNPREATTSFPEYEPGSVVNTSVNLVFGYELSPDWLLQTRVGIEFLDSAIEGSPLVDRDRLWSGSISLAYNPDLFQPRDYDGPDKDKNVEIRLGAFKSRIDSTLLLDPTEAQPGDEIDLEDFLGIADNETVAQLDVLYRIAHYHRLELGYFELKRSSPTTLQRDLWLGGTLYPEGTDVDSSSESRLLRLGYSYSLMRDRQKELGLTAGLAYWSFESKVSADEQQESDRVRIESLLPTIGVFGSVPLGDEWRLAADIDLFTLEFDHYEGYMAYLSLDLERKLGENFGAGLGYNFYGTRLKSKTDDLDGTLRVRYQGPKVYLSMRF